MSSEKLRRIQVVPSSLWWMMRSGQRLPPRTSLMRFAPRTPIMFSLLIQSGKNR